MIIHSLSCIDYTGPCPVPASNYASFGDGVLYSTAPEQFSVGEFRVTFYEYNNEYHCYRKIFTFGLYGDY